MKIFIVCSKKFYNRIPMIKEVLEEKGHQVFSPSGFDSPGEEDEYRLLGAEEHAKFKGAMYKQSEETIREMDGILVLNLDKNNQKNYVGGSTFLEMYDAFKMQKDIYLYNEVPHGILNDEIAGFNPTILNGNLNVIPMISKIQSLILSYMAMEDPEYKQIIPKRPLEMSKNLGLRFGVCQAEVIELTKRSLLSIQPLEGTQMQYYIINNLGLEQLDQYQNGIKNGKMKTLR